MSQKLADPAILERKARDFESASPQDVIAWAIEHYRPRIVLACSFGGPSGIVVLDMVLGIDPKTPVYYLDTGLLFPETYRLVSRVAERYRIDPIAVQPRLTVAEQNLAHGDSLWERDPDACCSIRKVETQRAFLKQYDAWITGVRRDQGKARGATPIAQWDTRFGLVKISPLAHWDEQMVWTYIRSHDLDYNELHDQHYPSLGCMPCTRAVSEGEDPRAGRWPNFGKVECGLHAATNEDGR